jgi:hypothetical protein
MPTNFTFCGKDFGSVVPSDATADQSDFTPLVTTATSSNTKGGMSRYADTSPVLKVRQLKRLQKEKRMKVPPPLGGSFTYTEPMSESRSDESNVEREITFAKDLKSESRSDESDVEREITFTKDLKFSMFNDIENSVFENSP